MKIVNLRKVKIGDKYPIVRISFKNRWGQIIKRDVIKGKFFWKYMDTDSPSLHDTALNIFFYSSAFDYDVNG